MKSINESNLNSKLIKELNSASKPNFSLIEEKLRVSRKTILNAIDKLKQKKLISNYTITINPNLRPSFRYVFLEIKTNPKEPELVENLLKIPQLRILDGILGEYSLHALFIVKSEEEYYKVLNKIDNIMASSYFKKYYIFEAIRVFKTNGITLSDRHVENIILDQLDQLILKILQEEQGLNLISTYEIRNLLKKNYNTDASQPTISMRIKGLKKAGIILNYALNFCPRKLGFKGKYIVRIKPKDPSKYDEIAFDLEKNRRITDLFRIGEEYGLLAIVRVKEIEDYSMFIKELYATDKIEDTWTNFILDELNPYTNFVIT
jgi:DNA-binding Lrp family transcriptional regulator